MVPDKPLKLIDILHQTVLNSGQIITRWDLNVAENANTSQAVADQQWQICMFFF